MIRKLIYPAFFTIFLSCNSDEYSPNQVFNRNTPINVNSKQIAKLQQQIPTDTITIAFSGDTQRFYEHAKDFVSNVNKRDDVDFVILNGDISDFGLLGEFEGVVDIYSKLNVPFISVVGNHDLVANGKDIYKRLFGPLNFTFTYGHVKFICHDTNGREYNFNHSTPNINWLKQHLTLENGITGLIPISHVPPRDGDFDPLIATPYQTLFNQTPGLIASLHSHQHAGLNTQYQNGNTGVPFIVSNAIVKRKYTLFKIVKNQINAAEISF